jgi:hypothetical protein
VTLNTDIPLFDLWKCADLNNEAGPAVKPVVSPEAGPAVKPVVVPAHLDWREKKGIPPLEGDIEPLLGREYDPQLGPGRKRVKGVLSYAPGVHYHDSCRISHMGVWTVL